MHKKYDMERSIYHAQLWLEEGQYDLALSALQHIQTHNPEQKRQIAYLSAWCQTILEQWTEARCLLLQLYPPGGIEDNWNNEKHNERERRAFYFFCLGNAAQSLKRYEEACQHYTQCLKLLSERRVKLPQMRIEALRSLGLSYMMSGFYVMAIKQYEEALQLCKNTPENEVLPDIYYGLCDANRLHGKLDDAYTSGVKALAMYEDRGLWSKLGQVQNLLGRICFRMGKYNEAATYYLESLSIATQDGNQEITLVNFTALADLRLAEERLDEAQHYCEHALEVADRLDDNYILGLMQLTCGNVMVAESKQATGEQHDILYAKAREFFEKAKELLAQTHDSVLLSEVYGKIAQILEQSGQPQEALSYWKTAYASLSHSTGQSLE
ncbi:MAG: tetratricopeptide repeat protein [Ktedonobacteraceae bacterium]